MFSLTVKEAPLAMVMLKEPLSSEASIIGSFVVTTGITTISACEGTLFETQLAAVFQSVLKMSLRIRDLEVQIPLALAPMVGLSHSALRSLIVQLGGAGLFFTEMLSARRLPSENEGKSPFLVRDDAKVI